MLLILAALLAAAKPPADEVDHLALAAALLRDGHADRAERVLAEVDLKAEGLALDRYHLLRGLCAFEQSRFDDALAGFTAAVEAGATDPAVQVFRAQAAWRVQDCRTALAALAAAGPAGEAHAPLFILRADCHAREEDPAAALQALVAGEARFPEEKRTFLRLRVQRLVALGLFQEAVEAGHALVDGPEASLEDHLFLGEALVQSRQHRAAREVLELARLRWPDDVRPTVQLAHAWLQAGALKTAAGLFEQAADRDPAFARDAAELHRRRGASFAALRQNARVLDQPVKLRQRVALLLDRERFAAVTALEPRLARLGLLAEDEELRYALAYAWFRQGSCGRPRRHSRS
ncbi:MAG: hypothetical protein R3F43_07210 [bacterium]